VALTNHPHLAPKLKKKYSCTSTPPLGLRGLLQGELYLYLLMLIALFYAEFLERLKSFLKEQQIAKRNKSQPIVRFQVLRAVSVNPLAPELFF